MMPAQSNQRTSKSARFPGILKAARELGVERSHLYRVLTGQRTSRSLKSRYEALQRETAR